jgi:hypothetical protein
MSIAAFAVADSAIADSSTFGQCRDEPPPSRKITARRDRRAVAESR